MGLKFSLKRLRQFGAPGTLLIDPVGPVVAKDVPGRFCIFLGYGTDTPGYRVLVPSTGRLDVYASLNVKISRGVMPYRDFLTKCRVDPTYAAIHGAWYDRVFETSIEGYSSLMSVVADSANGL